MSATQHLGQHSATGDAQWVLTAQGPRLFGKLKRNRDQIYSPASDNYKAEKNQWNNSFQTLDIRHQRTDSWDGGSKWCGLFSCPNLLSRESLQAMAQGEGTQAEPNSLLKLWIERQNSREAKEVRVYRVKHQRGKNYTEKLWKLAVSSPLFSGLLTILVRIRGNNLCTSDWAQNNLCPQRQVEIPHNSQAISRVLKRVLMVAWSKGWSVPANKGFKGAKCFQVT